MQVTVNVQLAKGEKLKASADDAARTILHALDGSDDKDTIYVAVQHVETAEAGNVSPPAPRIVEGEDE